MNKIQPLITIFLLLSFGANNAQTNFSVHGHLTQAFAISDGHQIFGISKEGTTDYRNLALQFRFDVTEFNSFVVQLNHTRVGKSPLMSFKEDIELDWAFFQHHFNEQFSIKIGKIQMPLGIYNEIRDVGVLLPFYGLPYAPYGDGGYMSETVDGLSVTYLNDVFDPWNLEFSFYAGQWKWLEWQNTPSSTKEFEQQAGIIEIAKGTGLQFVLNTPIDGLRIICGGQIGRATEGLNFTEEGILGPQYFYDGFVSIDAEFEDFFFRSEYLHMKMKKSDVGADVGYVQTGYFLTDELSINVQADLFKVNYFKLPDILVFLTGKKSTSLDYNQDYAAGLKYNFSSHYTLKLEGHFNRGHLVEDSLIDHFSDGPVDTYYSILSLSTSF